MARIFGHLSGWAAGLLLLATVAAPCAVAADAADEEGWHSLFDGKSLDGWKAKEKNQGANEWTVGLPSLDPDNPRRFTIADGTGVLVNDVGDHGEGWDLYTEAKFGDCRIEVEVMVPKGSNSGIYVMGEYEVQVFDSHGKEKPGSGDMGAIYGASPPPVNASKAPGEWQKYVIDIVAPRFDADGNKTENAKFLRVELNGKVLHENLEMPGPTPAGVTGREAPEGPIMFQGDHGPVAYRNLVIKPLPES